MTLGKINEDFSNRCFVRISGYYTQPKATLKYPRTPQRSIKSRISNLFNKNKNIKLVPTKQNNFLKRTMGLDLHIKNGDTIGIGSNLFINNGGVLDRLNMTPAKYHDLFPKNVSTQVAQNRQLGDCWLISTLNGLMRKAKGKIAVLKTFGQDYEDMYIKLPSKTVRFPKSQIATKPQEHLTGPKGLQMQEEAVAIKRIKTVSGDISELPYVAGVPSFLSRLNCGTQAEALHQYLPEVKPTIIEKDKKAAQKNIIKKYANKDDVFLGLMTDSNPKDPQKKFGEILIPRHAFVVTSYDKKAKLVRLQDPYEPERSIRLSFERLMKFPFTLTLAKLK